MDTIFMNSENSTTSKPHVLKLKLTNKLDLRIGKKTIKFQHLLHGENTKSLYSNNKFNISAPKWDNKFELPD